MVLISTSNLRPRSLEGLTPLRRIEIKPLRDDQESDTAEKLSRQPKFHLLIHPWTKLYATLRNSVYIEN